MSSTTYREDEAIPTAREIKKAIDGAVELLIHPDERTRRAALVLFMCFSHQVPRYKMLDRLVKLTASADEGVRQRATASLVEAGHYAMNVLLYRLGASRKPDVQLRLAKITARAGRQLSLLHVWLCRPKLERILRKARHEEVRAAVTKAIAELGVAAMTPEVNGSNKVMPLSI